MELINLALKSKPILFDPIINIYLVYKHVRKCMLIESANLNYNKKDINFLFDIIKSYNLVSYTEDEFLKRYLIMFPDTLINYLKEVQDEKEAQDQILGKYLGFLCYNHDYSNTNTDRLVISIFITYRNKRAEITQVCEKDKITLHDIDSYLEQTVKNIKNVLPKEFNVTGKIVENDSMISRLNALKTKNIKYIKDHIDDYIGDLENNWDVYDEKTKKTITLRLTKYIKNIDEETLKLYNHVFVHLWTNFIDQDDEAGNPQERIKLDEKLYTSIINRKRIDLT